MFKKLQVLLFGLFLTVASNATTLHIYVDSAHVVPENEEGGFALTAVNTATHEIFTLSENLLVPGEGITCEDKIRLKGTYRIQLNAFNVALGGNLMSQTFCSKHFFDLSESDVRLLVLNANLSDFDLMPCPLN